MNSLIKNLLVSFFFFGFVIQSFGLPGKQKPFVKGEKISYKIKYSLGFKWPVGEVTFEIRPDIQDLKGNKCLHFMAVGRTYGFYDPFFKVRDKYEAFVDTGSLLPLVTFRNVNEGGFHFQENLVFNHKANTIQSQKGTKKVPNNTMDILTVLYYARNLNLKNAEIGAKYMFTTFIDDSAFAVGLKVIGRETVKSSAGKFKCIKLSPILVKGRLFKSEDDMVLYVTDDENHIPIKVESSISVGSIRVELDEYEGLKFPLTSKL